jgi:hypothetical protein
VVADDEGVTYTPAVDQPRPRAQGWPAWQYIRHGYTRSAAVNLSSCGITPALAKSMQETTILPHQVRALSGLLSRGGIRRLIATRRATMDDVFAFNRVGEHSPEVARAWVHRTRVSGEHARWLHDWGVRPSTVAGWVAIDPLRRPADPYPLIALTRVRLGAHDEDLDAWLRLCALRAVPWHPGDPDLLAGDVGLLIAAGVGPREGNRILRTGTFDRTALALLAGLRT